MRVWLLGYDRLADKIPDPDQEEKLHEQQFQIKSFFILIVASNQTFLSYRGVDVQRLGQAEDLSVQRVGPHQGHGVARLASLNATLAARGAKTGGTLENRLGLAEDLGVAYLAALATRGAGTFELSPGERLFDQEFHIKISI